MVDQRLISIQHDPNQLRSINEFTGSLVRELNAAEGTPSKALMRELLAKGVRRALDIGGADGKKRFLDALSLNIHKFPLQEQQSLAKVWPVEISSEYRNLASFVEDAVDDTLPPRPPVPTMVASLAATAPSSIRPPVSAPPPPPLLALPAPPPQSLPPPMQPSPGGLTQVSGAPPPVAQPQPSPPHGNHALDDVRKRLHAMRPGDDAGSALVQQLLGDALAVEVRGVDEKSRLSFFSDLRLNLFKLPDSAQRSLVEHFLELRTEVARLVDTMAQEISRWLDEEKGAAQGGRQRDALLKKLRALFQATLSAPFLATYRHLEAAEKKKRGKEAFLLKIALCLRTCLEKKLAALPELTEQITQLRRHFFCIEGYGDMMEDWLQNRIKQLNEEFVQRAAAVISAGSLTEVLARLRRRFRPGRWMSLSDPQLEEDMFALFLDNAFPKHVISPESVAKVLKKLSSYGGGNFHVYVDIARTPPTSRPTYIGSPPQDAAEVALLEVLQRFPPFGPLRRGVSGRPSLLSFGRGEVEFILRSGSLFARPSPNERRPLVELPAEEFFEQYGPKEFPSAAVSAVRASSDPSFATGLPSTIIENAQVNLPDVAGAPFSFSGVPGGPEMVPSQQAPAVPFPPQPPGVQIVGGQAPMPLSGTPMPGAPPLLPATGAPQLSAPPLQALSIPPLVGMTGPAPLLLGGPGGAAGAGLSSVPRGPPGPPPLVAPGGGLARYEPYPGAGQHVLSGKFGLDDDEI